MLPRAPAGHGLLLLLALAPASCAPAAVVARPSRPAATPPHPAPAKPSIAGKPMVISRAHESQGVGALGWAPGGRAFATGDGGGVVTLWDGDDGSPRGVLRASRDPIKSLGFAGEVLVATDRRGFSFWEAASLARRGALPVELGQGAVIVRSEDGARVAFVNEGSLRVLDAALGRFTGSASVPQNAFVTLAMSADGTTLATGQSDGTIGIWDAASLTVRQTIAQPSSPRVRALAVSPDGRALAAATDAAPPALTLYDLPGHGQAVIGLDAPLSSGEGRLAWSSDGAVLAVALAEEAVLIDARTHAKSTYPTGGAPGVRFSSSGSSVALLGTYLRVWDLGSGEIHPFGDFSGNDVRVAALSPDGRRLAAVGSTNHYAGLWEAPAGRWLADLNTKGDALAELRWGRDGSSFSAVAGSARLERWDRDGGARETLLKSGHSVSPDGGAVAGRNEQRADVLDVLDSRTGALRATIAERLVRCTFSPDGARLAGVSGDALQLYDVTTGKVLQTLKGVGASYGFSPSGDLLAMDGEEPRLWDGRTGALRATLKAAGGKRSYQRVARWLAGEAAVVTLGQQGVTLWDAKTGKARGTYPEPPAPLPIEVSRGPLFAIARPAGVQLIDGSTGAEQRLLSSAHPCPHLAFRPDVAELAAACGDELDVWDLATGAMRVLDKLTEAPTSLSWSEDGSVLAVLSGGSIALLDPRTGAERRFDEVGNPAKSLAWSPAGNILLAATEGGLRLVRAADGATLSARMFHDHGASFPITFASNGLFAGPERGFVQALLGPDRLTSEKVGLYQLRDRFERSTLLADFLAGKPLALLPDVESGVGLPPAIEFVTAPPATVREPAVEIELHATDRGGGVSGVRVNGVWWNAHAGVTTWRVKVALEPGANQIVAAARNELGAVYSRPVMARVVRR